MKTLSSIAFVQFVLAQDSDRKYDMREEVRGSRTGSPLLHFCKDQGIRCASVGASDVYNMEGKVIATLECPTQAHFNYLNMEKDGFYGDLQVTIRDYWLEQLAISFGEPYPKEAPMGGKVIRRRLIAS